jgi:hypothetical protein
LGYAFLRWLDPANDSIYFLQFGQSGTIPTIAAMNPLNHTVTPDFPNQPPTPADHPDTTTLGAVFREWLKCFALYLSAVIAAGLVGLFFFWQLPLPESLTSLVDDPGGAPRYRSTPQTTTPITAVTPESPTSTDTLDEQPLDSTDMATAAQTTTESDDDPSAPASDASAEASDPVAEATSEEPPPPSPQAEIEQLLVEARQQMDNRRITAPANSNAFLTYRRVLELQPGHPGAVEGIQRIAAYYWDVAQQRFRQGQFDESLTYINRGLRAAPNNRALLSLRQEIQLTQQRQREEHAMRLEMERQWAAEQAEQARQEQIRREQQAQQSWWRQAPQHNVNHGFNQR